MLKHFRLAKKMTQQELAVKTGLSVYTIRKLENEGIKTNTRSTTLYYLSRGLNTSMDVLCYFGDEKQWQGKEA